MGFWPSWNYYKRNNWFTHNSICWCCIVTLDYFAFQKKSLGSPRYSLLRVIALCNITGGDVNKCFMKSD